LITIEPFEVVHRAMKKKSEEEEKSRNKTIIGGFIEDCKQTSKIKWNLYFFFSSFLFSSFFFEKATLKGDSLSLTKE